jgi:hypothetical protein
MKPKNVTAPTRERRGGKGLQALCLALYRIACSAEFPVSVLLLALCLFLIWGVLK